MIDVKQSDGWESSLPVLKGGRHRPVLLIPAEKTN
jgi:hypothetical protein